MLNHRTLTKLVAGLFVATGLFAASVAPAAAQDTGWNGTRIASYDGHGNSGR
jgi:hypothetical protein